MRMIKKHYLYFIAYITYFGFNNSYAIYGQRAGGKQQSLGEGSRNVAGALFDISNLWLAVAMIAGIGFLFVGIVKYFEHRKNPIQTPLGQVLLLLFLAIALIGTYVFIQFGDSGYVMLQEIFE